VYSFFIFFEIPVEESFFGEQLQPSCLTCSEKQASAYALAKKRGQARVRLSGGGAESPTVLIFKYSHA